MQYNYTVSWSVDVEADTAEEAAQAAQEYFASPSLPRVWKVTGGEISNAVQYVKEVD